jgi:large subunit ribosomal protein L15
MKLNQIAARAGSTKARTRVGRGIGSGKGKTGGRGGKGQTARSGVRIKGFEGGQMPLHRRLPKRGFRNTSFQLSLNEINVGKVQAAIDAGKLDAKNPVDAAAMVKAGLLSRARDGVKLLGHGELKAKVEFTVWRASKSAIAAVEKAGGSVKILAPAKEADAEPRGKNARFAAGLDKPKIIESAPPPSKADAKKKAEAKAEAKLAPKTDRKPNPAGKASE